MDAHFSSNHQDWETPISFFTMMEKEHGPFDLDVCALPHNAKCSVFYSPVEDGLKQDWFGTCWMNPPYGRNIAHWMHKAVDEVMNGNAKKVVCLVPSRTDTAWWHDYAMQGEIVFLRGRLKFEGAKNSAPFPSAVVIFEGEVKHD